MVEELEGVFNITSEKFLSIRDRFRDASPEERDAWIIEQSLNLDPQVEEYWNLLRYTVWESDYIPGIFGFSDTQATPENRSYVAAVTLELAIQAHKTQESDNIIYLF